MKNLIYLTERNPDYDSPLEDFEKVRRQFEARGFPKYVYINPRFTVQSDTFTETLIEIVKQCQREWIKCIDGTLGCHNRRCPDFMTAYCERTKEDRFRSWSIIRVGVYFLKGKQVNGNAWHRFQPRRNSSAKVIRNDLKNAADLPISAYEDVLDEIEDLLLGKPRTHKREIKNSRSHVQFDFFPETREQHAATDDFYDLLLSDDFDFEQYYADSNHLVR